MNRGGTTFEESLGLGDEQKIIFTENNWKEIFSEIFIKNDGRDGFLNKEELNIAFMCLAAIRNSTALEKNIQYSKEYFAQCDIFLCRLSKIAPEIVFE